MVLTVSEHLQVNANASQIDHGQIDRLFRQYVATEGRSFVDTTDKYASMTKLFTSVVATDGAMTLHSNLPRCGDDQALEEWIRGDALRGRPTGSSLGAPPVDSTDDRTIMLMRRLVANLCVYLDACRSDCEPPLGVVTRHGRVHGRRNYVVGRAVKLPGHVREAARALAESHVRHAAWKVRSRFIVRGHWRHPPFWKSRAEYKLIWIRPYWRGPETGPELRRIYAAAAHGESEAEAKNDC